MKQLALALFFVTIFAGPSLAQWYEGGTLHRATAAEWASASASNRLATAGDWSVAILGENRVQQMGMNGLRAYARQLVNCVSEAVSGGHQNQAVSEVAASCGMLMDN